MGDKYFCNSKLYLVVFFFIFQKKKKGFIFVNFLGLLFPLVDPPVL